MIIFDGYQTASQIEAELKSKVQNLVKQGKKLKIASILFQEDQGSKLYTQLKKDAASRVGINYQVSNFAMAADLDLVMQQIQKENEDPTVTGIIIQKPWTSSWVQITGRDRSEFENWWQLLTDQIDQKKDVDGLKSTTLASIKDNSWQQKGYVLPATAAAVVTILNKNQIDLTNKKVILVGKSNLLGVPLFYYLKNQQIDTQLLGSVDLKKRLDSGLALKDADLLISSTGQNNLITGDMLKPGVVAVDVGEPKGDFDFPTVSQVASFITPVPGGVGPMTVVSLLENAISLTNN